MGLRKTRYLHCQMRDEWDATNGFSVQFDSCEDGDFDEQGRPDAFVFVRSTICSKDDHFCKATARDILANAPAVKVRVVDVPNYVVDIHFKAKGMKPLTHPRRGNQYAWLWKYFL